MEIFSDGMCCPNICYSNIVFHYKNVHHPNIFSYGYSEWERETRGMNSGMLWEGELKSAAVNNYQCEGTISMVP